MESIEDRAIKILTSLRTEELDEVFVQSVWDVDFAEEPDLLQQNIPLDDLEIPLKDVLISAVDVCREIALRAVHRNFTASEGESLEQPNSSADLTASSSSLLSGESGAPQSEHSKFWRTLFQSGTNCRNLLAFIYGITYKGQQKRALWSEKELSLICACLYFLLISMPGSSAFKIYHGQLFQIVLSTLKTTCQPTGQKRKHGKQDKNAPKRKKTDNATKAQNQQLSSSDVSDGAGVANESSDDENFDVVLSLEETNKLKMLCKSALNDLLICIFAFSLKSDKEAKDHLIQILYNFTYTEDYVSIPFENMNVNDIKTVQKQRGLVSLAYLGLKMLCQQSHGSVQETFLAVVKALLPNILMSRVNVATISKSHQLLKEQSTNFLCHLISDIGEPVFDGAQILIHHLCARVTDRAEYRSKVAIEVVHIMRTLPIHIYAKVMQWLYSYIRSTKINYRIFGLELFMQLLEEPERECDASIPNHVAPLIQHRFLLSVIIDRCKDKASSVRAKALSVLVSCLSSSIQSLCNMCKEIFLSCSGGHRDNHPAEYIPVVLERSQLQPEAGDAQEGEENAVAEDEVDEDCTPLVGNIPCGCQLQEMLLQRCEDSKVHVRKVSVQLLESVICLENEFSSSKILQAIAVRCFDPGTLVRKQILQSLTSILLVFPTSRVVQKIWVDNVLPLVVDSETSVQEKCLELMASVIINNLYDYHSTIHCVETEVAWQIMGHIAVPVHQDLQRYFQKAVHLWARSGVIRPKILSALKHEVGGENNAGFWLLASQLVHYADISDPSFAINYWEQCCSDLETVPVSILKQVLQVLGSSTKHIPVQKLLVLKVMLEERIKRFEFPSEVISTALKTLEKIYLAVKKLDNEQKTKPIYMDLIKTCDAFLSSHLLETSLKTEEDLEEKIVRHVVTLGEVAQTYPKGITKHISLLVQSMIVSELPDPLVSKTKARALLFSSVKPSDNRTRYSSGLNQLSQTPLRKVFLSPRVRAHAFVTLGKLCLQDEMLAKKCVPALAKELDTSESDIVRNNICIIMGDMCIRYTILVDPYLPSVTVCLRDPSILVRYQVLTVLTQLLQEDYIKWKGSLFFHMLFTLLDTDGKIRELAQYCLGHLLLRRHPHIFFQHFIPCLVYFNCYSKHGTYTTFPKTDREVKLFSLKGQHNKKKRIHLYKFLLENMNDDERFLLMTKLCEDILGTFADGKLPLDSDSNGLIQDTLLVCSCEEIKLSSLRSSAQDEADEGDEMAALAVTVKKTVISQLVKQNMIKNIVPIIISLKKLLENAKSTLLRDLMHFLREILKDYRTEVKEILSNDKQLAQEIDFDMRRFEQQEEEERQVAQDMQNISLRADGAVALAANESAANVQAAPVPNVEGTPKNAPKGSASVPSTPVQTSTPGTPALVTSIQKEARIMLHRLNSDRALTPKQKSMLLSEERSRRGSISESVGKKKELQVVLQKLSADKRFSIQRKLHFSDGEGSGKSSGSSSPRGSDAERMPEIPGSPGAPTQSRIPETPAGTSTRCALVSSVQKEARITLHRLVVDKLMMKQKSLLANEQPQGSSDSGSQGSSESRKAPEDERTQLALQSGDQKGHSPLHPQGDSPQDQDALSSEESSLQDNERIHHAARAMSTPCKLLKDVSFGDEVSFIKEDPP